MKHTAILAFYCYRGIFISLPCSRVQEVFRLCLDFQDRNWGSNVNNFILISLITAGRSTVYSFPVLASVFSAWVSWADLGQAKISLSPMRSCCGWLERRRLCHRDGGRGCSGQHKWEAAQMDVWMNSATAEQDGALPSSPAEQRGNSALCCTLVPPRKAKAALTSRCTTANVFGFSVAVDDLGAKIFVAQGSGELLSVMHLWLLQAPCRCHHWAIPRAAFGSCCCPFSSQLLGEGGMNKTFTSWSYHGDEHLPDVCSGYMRHKCQPCSWLKSARNDLATAGISWEIYVLYVTDITGPLPYTLKLSEKNWKLDVVLFIRLSLSPPVQLANIYYSL